MSLKIANQIMGGDADLVSNNSPAFIPWEEVRATLRTEPLIDIQNVAQFFAESGQSIVIGDLPTCAPPFKSFWTECRFPQDSGSTAVHWKSERRGRGWRVWMTIVYGDRRVVQSTTSELVLDEHGRLDGDGGTIKTFFPDDRWAIASHLFAVSLMHCKNVTLREERVSEKLQKARARRGRPGFLVKWSVLEIEPMKKILRSEGKSESLGLPEALRICRGHFKDYRQSGLFGKIKGVFWWDATVRGESKNGVIIKDYSVNPPKVSEG